MTAAQMKTMGVEKPQIRVFAAGQTYVDTNLSQVPAGSQIDGPGIIVKSRGHIAFQFWNDKYSHKNEIWSYSSLCEDLDIKFAYFYLLTQAEELVSLAKSKSVKLPQLAVADTDRLAIPVPPIEVQREIVSILDKFTVLEAELEAELEARRKQYEHYRNELLTNDSISRNRFTLESICTLITSGGTPPTDKQDEYYGGDIPWVRTTDVSNSGIFDTPIKITAEGLKNSSAKMIPPQSLIIAMIGATVGKVAYTEIEVSTNQNCCNLVIDPQIANYKYVYHWLLNSTQMLISLAPGAVPILNAGAIRQISIYLPDVPTQTQIANQLDQFSDLTMSLDSGLPAEISARRKQYEYFREKLLTFKELEVA